jgi:hypothetical protein
MKKFAVTEVCVYELTADNEKDAEQKFLNTDSGTRDRTMFVQVSDRMIEPARPNGYPCDIL